MFDFLFDNPIVLLAVIYALVRLFRGKKKQDGAATAGRPVARATSAAEEARRRAAERAAPKPLEQRLEELALEWQAKLEGKSPASMRTGPAEPLAAAGEAPQPATLGAAGRQAAALQTGSLESTSLERASLESGSLERASLESGSLERESLEPVSLERASLERASLESSAREGSHFEGRSLESADEGAFTFREAGSASDYHLDSFTGFRPAERTQRRPASEGAAPPESSGALFASAGDVRRAFILSEILARPRSQRPIAAR